MIRRLSAALALAALGGCIKAPDVVLVDRHTQLEEQAAGRLPTQQAALAQSGVAPGPAPFTSGQLAQSGWHSVSGHDAIAALYAGYQDDAAVLDQLLLRRCIGEGREATLLATPDRCTGAVDVADMSRRLERANRNRRQVWLYIQAQRPGTTLDEVRAAWRVEQQRAVVCGAPWQRDDGSWEVKACP